MGRGRKLPVFLTGDEPDRLLSQMRSERDRLIVLIGLHLGLRVSEVTRLRAEHVDFDQGQLLVFQGKGAKDRYVPLNSKVAGPLKTWIGDKKEGWLFLARGGQKPLSTRAVQFIIEYAAKRAGIKRPEGQHRITPHVLRHTFASRLVANGVDIAVVRDLLGHSSISITSQYLHTNTARLRSAVETL